MFKYYLVMTNRSASSHAVTVVAVTGWLAYSARHLKQISHIKDRCKVYQWQAQPMFSLILLSSEQQLCVEVYRRAS